MLKEENVEKKNSMQNSGKLQTKSSGNFPSKCFLFLRGIAITKKKLKKLRKLEKDHDRDVHPLPTRTKPDITLTKFL